MVETRYEEVTNRIDVSPLDQTNHLQANQILNGFSRYLECTRHSEPLCVPRHSSGHLLFLDQHVILNK